MVILELNNTNVNKLTITSNDGIGILKLYASNVNTCDISSLRDNGNYYESVPLIYSDSSELNVNYWDVDLNIVSNLDTINAYNHNKIYFNYDDIYNILYASPQWISLNQYYSTYLKVNNTGSYNLIRSRGGSVG